ncbi:hypothetical protein G7077_01350 [Sphingomonas piscis]|uniref:Uncharacterized protein n=1 Tax=Sphingomonas piscis TaxID=2714943 RepID=A0A6G7YLZ2_9SPHN|nr:hypothetical protein [Sphingomonas piscis]QIK77758.1 hypothetical protein G7077_01350 [Sphingomonas piscis]
MSLPETLVPALAATPTTRDKDARETSTGCRERATADTARSLVMDTANGRLIFEKSAANWTKRADMLHRIETGIEARLRAPQPVAQLQVELTTAEIAEDAAFVRFG